MELLGFIKEIFMHRIPNKSGMKETHWKILIKNVNFRNKGIQGSFFFFFSILST